MTDATGLSGFDRVDPPERDLRATFEVVDVGDAQLGLIADSDNNDAWIQSDETVCLGDER